MAAWQALLLAFPLAFTLAFPSALPLALTLAFPLPLASSSALGPKLTMADWRGRLAWRIGGIVRPRVSLGVRCLVIDVHQRVLLVRHIYTGGWHAPGGAVDPHESAAEAAAREVWEETGVRLELPPRLHGLFFNKALAGRDHVAVFAVLDHPAIDDRALKPRAGEIAEAKLAPIEALPDGVTPATRRRLAEVLGGTAKDDVW